MLEVFTYSFLLSVTAYVFNFVLIEPGHLFSLWGKLLDWMSSNKVLFYISKPLGGCVYCFSGEMALFYYWWKFGFNLEIIFFISLTIIFVECLIMLRRLIF